MAVSLFDTRTMLRMLEQAKRPKSFLKDTFFATQTPFDTEYVDIDIIKGKRRMAPFVSPRVGSKTVDRNGYETKIYKPVLVSPDTITTAEDLMKRAPGETIYGAGSPDIRAAAMLARDMMELDDMITRREEWMAAQVLFTGAVDMVGEGVNESVSFGLTNTATLASGAQWDESTSNPIGDLVTARKTIIQGSGVTPTMAILGSDAAATFTGNSKVLAALDNRRTEMGMLAPDPNRGNGLTYIGYIAEAGLELWGYDEWYLDDSGVEQPMIPVNKVLVGSSQARCEMLYGAVVDVNRGTFAIPRVPKSWTQEKPSARFVQISSRPLPAMLQPDAFYVYTVV